MALLNLFLSAFLFLTVNPTFSAEELSQVKKIQGKVFINGRKASLGQTLTWGAEIESKGKKSFVEIAVKGGHLLRLFNGKVKLEKSEEQDENPVFNLWSGQLYSALKKLAPGNSVKYKTRSSVSIGVRGTKFMIEEKEDSSYVCVCEGVVDIYHPGKKAEVQFSVKAHEDLWVYPGKERTAPQKSTEQMDKMVKDVFGEMGV